MTVEQLWWTTLGIYVVVLLVVAALLTLILLEAKKIHAGVSEIWNVGQKVANNTIHISLLERTNQLAGQILSSAKGIVGATALAEGVIMAVNATVTFLGIKHAIPEMKKAGGGAIVIGARSPPAALVVAEEAAALGQGQHLRKQVVVAGPRTAVQQQHRRGVGIAVFGPIERHRRGGGETVRARRGNGWHAQGAGSYRHLTLPTSYSV